MRLSLEEMRYISLVQDLTGATIRDCIVDEENDTLIFIVKEGEAGLAIGKNGSNVKKVKMILKKNIEIVEYSNEFDRFVRNIFAPARIASIKKVEQPGGRTVLYVSVHPQDKGIAIGKGGRNVHKAKLILKRYYNIDNVIIT
ncbi:MAG: NusA-like transcription termination signal-binding factor [Desulfurococcales archaeon]|nr:NusA-like transcription termination signal-binding factor [Desulfurococcales archaeon]